MAVMFEICSETLWRASGDNHFVKKGIDLQRMLALRYEFRSRAMENPATKSAAGQQDHLQPMTLYGALDRQRSGLKAVG
jgi:hypothetical protein